MHIDRRLLSQAGIARWDLAGTVLTGVASGGIVVAQAFILSRIIGDVFLAGMALEDVSDSILAFFCLSLGRAGLAWGGEVLAQRAASAVKSRLRDRTLTHLSLLGPSYLRNERTGELSTSLMEGVEALDAYFGQYLPQLARSVLVPVLVLGFVLPLDPLSGLVLILTAPLIPVFMVLIGKTASDRNRKQWVALGRMSARFLDALQGLTTLKLFGRSAAQAQLVDRASQRFRQITMGVLRIAFLSALVLEMAATLSTAVVAVEVGLRLLYGSLVFQQALAVLILAPEFYKPLRALGGAFHTGLPAVEAADRLFGILMTPPVCAAVGPDEQGPYRSLPSDSPPAIRFDSVTFHYDASASPAIENVSFEIPPGRRLALVGETGAGKSTVAGLLLRFADPASGSIYWDELLSRDVSPAAWRSRIAWVPQSPYLFQGSVAENIALSSKDAPQDCIVDAAVRANAHEFILGLPQGYDTPVGERGATLSGGQAQRVAIARAFLKAAPLLVLDEPTSHLDPEQDALAQVALDNLMASRTVLLIAHRLGTVARADRIVLLSRGEAPEYGTHASLLSGSARYARLVAAHTGGA
jgi:ATP-binding cassette, subfamily C, bacterial CydD